LQSLTPLFSGKTSLQILAVTTHFGRVSLSLILAFRPLVKKPALGRFIGMSTQVPIDISVVHQPAFEDFGLLGRGRTKHAFSQGLEQYADISGGLCLGNLPRIGSAPTFQAYSGAMFILGKGTFLVQGVAEKG